MSRVDYTKMRLPFSHIFTCFKSICLKAISFASKLLSVVILLLGIVYFILTHTYKTQSLSIGFLVILFSELHIIKRFYLLF